MNIKEAYKEWSNQYDTNENKTRDLEAVALRAVLSKMDINKVLEFGCGTGKNTVWFEQNAKEILSADFSEAMIAKAAEKINSPKVQFTVADINEPWDFSKEKYDLVSFSLVLEHIQNIEAVFNKINQVTESGAFVYIGELHPFKQYAGSKARYTAPEGEQIVTCYTHNMSDFITAANKYNFSLMDLEEWFDNNDRSQIPRILTLLFKKH
ncbi:MAG: class I SAM-dependent methyltransferase [Sediminibacterium sp.]